MTMRHEIRALQQRLGITAVHVTHDREEAMTMADRIVILDAGGSRRSARPRRSIHRPASPFVAGFMGADNVDRAASRAARDGRPSAPATRIAGARRARPRRVAAARRVRSRYFRDDVASARRARRRRRRGDRAVPARIARAQLSGRALSLSQSTAAGASSRSTTPHVMSSGAAVGAAHSAARLHICSRRPKPRSQYTDKEETMRMSRSLFAALRLASLPSPASAQTTQRRHRRRPEHGRLRQRLSRADVREEQSRRQGARRRHRPGRCRIAEDLREARGPEKAGNAAWDIDVAVVHQKAARRRWSTTSCSRRIATTSRPASWSPRDSAKNALGANVDGYVMPMFHSQIAIAYNPDLVKTPPKSFTELDEWVKKNPKQFGYNGIKGGMSGVGFVIGWVYANGGDADKLEKGPYDPADEGRRGTSRSPSLKEFNQNVVMTPGQCRHARHAQPRRDRDGPGLGRHVLHLEGRRQDAARR